MRRIVIALGATISGLVLLFSWPTSTNRPVLEASDTETETARTSAATGSGSTTGAGTPTRATRTYDGAAATTRFGDVQVQITVADGVITDAVATDYPDRDPHDQRINAYAIPILEAATVDAQSASIDMVSGATVTSLGYVQSLQDALDQAGL